MSPEGDMQEAAVAAMGVAEEKGEAMAGAGSAAMDGAGAGDIAVRLRRTGAEVGGPARTRRVGVGVAAIVFAVAFNVPFSVLGATFEYPDVLRRPAGEVLELFAVGGATLVLTWHAFALCALALVPFAFAFALTPQRVASRPVLSIGAAVAGALSGLAQAIGLWRWVFVVPGLARVHGDAAASEDAKLAAERTFDVLNQYGGVAIGEHLGQTLLALFVVLMAGLQWSERARVSSVLGFVAAAAILGGTGEGLMIALGQSGEVFSLVTIGGFVGLTVWLIVSGVGLVRGSR